VTLLFEADKLGVADEEAVLAEDYSVSAACHEDWVSAYRVFGPHNRLFYILERPRGLGSSCVLSRGRRTRSVPFLGGVSALRHSDVVDVVHLLC
jgi:hypothetical protein